ncbi:MAG TPA: iron dicitrate transport regulator FecR [Prolixibacteraceae bacterium]|nr:iron dicitrate transport regulator FecR [Prolixibacteraceae bacterium]
MKQNIQHLIQKFTEGQLSLKEHIELADQLADEQNLTAEVVLNQDWQEKLLSEINPDHDLKPILDRVHHQIRLNEEAGSQRLNWWLSFQRIAAILIFPLLLSFLAYFYWPSKPAVIPVSYAEIQCPMGVRTKFQLPDGSTGFLNSGSRLKYPVQFIGERKVELSGEAFFNVVHNKEIPFHVNTRNLDIKVLGTTFNVIANEDETTEEIVLQTGKVDVSTLTGKKLAILKPNEQIRLDIEKQTFVKNEVEASQYTTWKEGKLVFRNENMQQVAQRLSRWYNAEVVVDDRLLDNYSFHATFMDEPLDEVLKLLSITTPLSFKEEKRASNADGIFQKRKIILRINQSKINHFK